MEHFLMDEQFALKVDQLTVSYDKTPVLWDVTLSVPQGELVGIVGPNGAGKSTFLKSLMDFVPLVAGKTELLGGSLSSVRQHVAYVPQRESVDWDFPITVRELVLMGRYGRLKWYQRPRQADYDAVDQYLALVGLEAFSNRQISELSGGQQQRAFLARALIQEAKLYFFDEPFAGVDAATEAVLVKELKRLVQSGKTVFVVHHDLNSVVNFFSWVILINLRLIGSGKTAEVFTPENLQRAYGKNYQLLDDAARLAFKKFGGTD